MSKHPRSPTTADKPGEPVNLIERSAKNAPELLSQRRLELLYAIESRAVTIIRNSSAVDLNSQLLQYLCQAQWTQSGQKIAYAHHSDQQAIRVANHVNHVCSTASLAQHQHPFNTSSTYSTAEQNISSIITLSYTSLVLECLQDPLLARYSVIVVDLTHQTCGAESTILLSLVKKILQKRTNDQGLHIALLIPGMGQVKWLREYFGFADTAIVNIPKEQNMPTPDIHYLTEPCEDYLSKTANLVLQIHKDELSGDIIVYLPGEKAVKTIVDLLEPILASSVLDLRIVSMVERQGEYDTFSELISANARSGSSTRVVYLSSKSQCVIPQDSNILYVIDSGLTEQVVTRGPIQHHMAIAIGRTTAAEHVQLIATGSQQQQQQQQQRQRRPAKIYRLYTYTAHTSSMFPSHDCLYSSTELAPMLLVLGALGVDNLVRFDYLPPAPAPETMAGATEYLVAHNMLTSDTGQLSGDYGKQTVHLLPLSIPWALCLLNSVRSLGCAREIRAIACMEAAGFNTPRGTDHEGTWMEMFAVREGDLISWANVLLAFQQTSFKKRRRWCARYHLPCGVLEEADKINAWVVDRLVKLGFSSKMIQSTCGGQVEVLQRCLVSGLFLGAATKQQNADGYQTIQGDQTVYLHPSLVYPKLDPPECIVFNRAVESPTTGRLYVNGYISADISWLTELAPQYFTEH